MGDELDKTDFTALIFYKDDEIKQIKRLQQKDLFRDIVQLKNQAAEDAIPLYQNKIDIGYFAPKL